MSDAEFRRLVLTTLNHILKIVLTITTHSSTLEFSGPRVDARKQAMSFSRSLDARLREDIDYTRTEGS